MKNVQASVTVRNSLRKLGDDIKTARRRRRLPMRLVAERACIGLSTLGKIEKGDANVSIGNYASVFWALGMGTPLGLLISPSSDEVGLELDLEKLPQRIHATKVKPYGERN